MTMVQTHMVQYLNRSSKKKSILRCRLSISCIREGSNTCNQKGECTKEVGSGYDKRKVPLRRKGVSLHPWRNTPSNHWRTLLTCMVNLSPRSNGRKATDEINDREDCEEGISQHPHTRLGGGTAYKGRMATRAHQA